MLCPFGCQEDPQGYTRLLFGDDGWVWTSEENTARLKRLAEHFNFVWATAWEHEANDALGPHHGLGPLEVIEFSVFPGRGLYPGSATWKLPWVEEWAEAHRGPLAWIDDDLSEDAVMWAEVRTALVAPTLVYKTDCTVGLTDEVVDDLLAWCPCCDES